MFLYTHRSEERRSERLHSRWRHPETAVSRSFSRCDRIPLQLRLHCTAAARDRPVTQLPAGL